MSWIEIINFWFYEIEPKQWWKKDSTFDALLAKKFGSLHEQASRCELYEWRGAALGRLAEILLLDQLSRNIHRGTNLAFQNDPLALALAQEAIALEVDRELSQLECSMLYMPFMHSESLKIHDVALKLFRQNGIASNYEYELKHRAVIERFGRYPHRNEILGRESTAEEIEFLSEPGSRF